MKKILLASTALVLSAGLAQAQAVRIGGEGRMGIQYDSNGFALFGSNYRQENRLQLNFSVGVTGDHGLSFGAFTRARMNNGAAAMFSGSRVWVEAAGLRLTFGNQDGAYRGAGTAFGYLGGCGIGYEGGQQCGDASPGLNRTQGFDSNGGGAQARARLDYTFGDIRVALSSDRGGATELGVRTTFDAFTVALGYSNRGALGNGALVDGSTLSLSGFYNGGTWGAGLLVSRLSNSGVSSQTTYTLAVNAELGGGRAYAYVGRVGAYAGGVGQLTGTVNAYGVNYGYGLGGGATLTVGGERVGGRTTASVGVAFSF